MKRRRFVVAALLGASGVLSAACAPNEDPPDSSAAADVPAVLATVGGQPVTLADVRSRAGDGLDQLEMGYRKARYDLINTTLQQILQERLLSAEEERTGKTLDELVLAEAGGSFDPSEEQIQTWYRDNPTRIGNRSLEQMHDGIAAFLRAQHRGEAQAKLLRRLSEAEGVVVHLEPLRVRFADQDAPARGPADAPVTVEVFSDFQCPYCGGTYQTLKQVTEAFGDTVRIVYRQFPLSGIHPQAQKAAEASLCAQEQGRFWELHDLMFEEQDRLDVSDLKEKAGRLGLDQARFDTCLDSGSTVQQVQADQREGRLVGVSGTPAMFVNGIAVPGGAVPYGVLAQAIHEELGRIGR